MNNKSLFTLLGAILGMFLGRGNLIMIFLGAFLGNLFAKQVQENKKVSSSIFTQPLSRQSLFLQTTFAVLGYISKSKGRVTEADISLAKTLMTRYNLNETSKQLCINAFNLGKNNNFQLRTVLKELKNVCDRKLIKTFLNIQLEAVFLDNEISNEEKNILYIIADELGISRVQLEQIIMFAELSRHFSGRSNSQHQGYQRQYRYEQNSSSSNNGGYYGSYNNTNYLADAYKILGVNSSADKTTVKRAYRKLMNEYHPDKLVAKGLPQEMMEAAKEKAQNIQAAYDLICKEKGWK